MRVCKHGFNVKMFCCARGNHASTNLKKFLSRKLDKFTLFTQILRLMKLGKQHPTSLQDKKPFPMEGFVLTPRLAYNASLRISRFGNSLLTKLT